MGSETRHQRYGTEAWNRSAARNNIDKHLQNPTIKEGKITKAVIASPRSSLSSNVRTLNNADDEESGLHNTYLDYEHSKQMPSQSSQNTYYTSSITGTRLGSNASGASSAGYQAASYASRAAAPPKEEVSKPYTSSYNGYTESPFQALAQGVESSGNQLPHLRAPSNTSRPSAQSSKNSSSLTPHALALSSAASSQASQVRVDGRSFLSVKFARFWKRFFGAVREARFAFLISSSLSPLDKSIDADSSMMYSSLLTFIHHTYAILRLSPRSTR